MYAVSLVLVVRGLVSDDGGADLGVAFNFGWISI